MARYKSIKPNLENPKFKLAQKKDRIRKTVDLVYVVLFLVCILICGLNQTNEQIVGWGLIIMGVFSIPVAVFHIYTDKKGWEPLFWYDAPEIRQYTDKKTREKDLEEYRFVRGIEAVFLVLFSLGLPIFGILRLFGIL